MQHIHSLCYATIHLIITSHMHILCLAFTKYTCMFTGSDYTADITTGTAASAAITTATPVAPSLPPATPMNPQNATITPSTVYQYQTPAIRRAPLSSSSSSSSSSTGPISTPSLPRNPCLLAFDELSSIIQRGGAIPSPKVWSGFCTEIARCCVGVVLLRCTEIERRYQCPKKSAQK